MELTPREILRKVTKRQNLEKHQRQKTKDWTESWTCKVVGQGTIDGWMEVTTSMCCHDVIMSENHHHDKKQVMMNESKKEEWIGWRRSMRPKSKNKDRLNSWMYLEDCDTKRKFRKLHLLQQEYAWHFCDTKPKAKPKRVVNIPLRADALFRGHLLPI